MGLLVTFDLIQLSPRHVAKVNNYHLIMAERLALALENLAKSGQLDKCLDVLEKATSEEEEEEQRTSTSLPGGQRKKLEIVYMH